MSLAVGLILFVLRRAGENAFLTITVIVLTLLSAFAWRKYRVYLPPEFQLMQPNSFSDRYFSVLLGIFYYRFWWWDLLLHAGSDFLLGIVGFIALGR